MPRRVVIVGLGPDGEGRLITLEAAEKLSRAQAVFTLPKLEGIVRKFCPQETDVVHISHAAAALLQSVAKEIEESQYDDVAIAVSGDPTFASLGSRLCRFLVERGLEVDITPGISSLQLAAARLRLDWANSLVLDMHGKGCEEALRRAVTMAELGYLVFTTLSPRIKAEDVAGFLSEAGFPSAELLVCENLGTGRERILKSHARALADMQTHHNAILMIKPLDSRLVYGIRDQEIYTPKEVPGPTKEEIRAITACKARLKPGHRVIEIGCGTGALTVELALRVLPDGLVYAIDYRREAIEATLANARRYGVAHAVKTIQGKAPEVFSMLNERFDVAVIGGTENLKGVVMELDRKLLAENRRIVVNAVSMGSLASSYGVLTALGYEVEVVCSFIARTRRLKQHLVFSSLNPVFIVVGEKVGA